jgi:hypothetical protein
VIACCEQMTKWGGWRGDLTLDRLGPAARGGGRDRSAWTGSSSPWATERFPVRGVTYGTFRPRDDGARFPPPSTLRADLTPWVLRGSRWCAPTRSRRPTSSTPPATPGCGCSPASSTPTGATSSAPRAGSAAGWPEAADRGAGRGTPPGRRRPGVRPVPRQRDPRRRHPLVRHHGHRRGHRRAGGGRAARGPDRLVTYGNYPTAEYLDLPELDFLTFNVFLEDPATPALPDPAPPPRRRPAARAGRGRAARRRREPDGRAAPGGAHRRQLETAPSGGSPAPACSRGPTSGGWATPRSRDGGSA